MTRAWLPILIVALALSGCAQQRAAPASAPVRSGAVADSAHTERALEVCDVINPGEGDGIGGTGCKAETD